VPQFFGKEPADYQRQYEVTPDGRWLTMTRFDSDSNAWLLYLYDIPQNQTMRVSVDENFDPAGLRLFDWSADSRWLAITENGSVRLLEPESGYEELVAAKQTSCQTAVWVN
jgi:hypothetical protein